MEHIGFQRSLWLKVSTGCSLVRDPLPIKLDSYPNALGTNIHHVLKGSSLIHVSKNSVPSNMLGFHLASLSTNFSGTEPRCGGSHLQALSSGSCGLRQ